MTVAIDAPIACTLEPEAMPGRLDDWQSLLEYVQEREMMDDGIRVLFRPTLTLDHLVRLVAAEHQCCRFFRFAITIDGRGVGLEVRAPQEALAIVTSLFGTMA